MNALRPALATTGWGVYCACSWTWCIGMFLPVILLGRYGWWGFLAFAIPNVLGCAAFGYVLRTRERSAQLVQQHGRMMSLFSLVTVGYHVFFLGFVCWLLMPIDVGEETLWLALSVPVVVLLLGQVLADVPTRVWPVLAVFVYGISLAVFASIGIQPLHELSWQGEHATIDAAWLSPVIVLGFALCPYLDLTFHRALQHSPSRHAFGVFGVTFAIMLVVTCTYWDILITDLSWLVLAHLLVQTVFTVGAHMREYRCHHDRPELPGFNAPARLMMLAPVLALPLAFIGAFTLSPLEASVDTYLRYLVFYGLVFPAYAMLFMGRGGIDLTRRNVVLFALTCAAFMPLYEAGFLHRQAWVLVAPPLVLLLWRVRTTLGLASMPEPQDGAGKAA